MSVVAGPVFRQRKSAGEKIRVLVVDDSVVIRHLLRQALQEEPAIEIVGVESNGAGALASIPALKPDVVTLDIEMPQMDGLETLRRIRASWPRLRIIMCSSLTTRGASATFEALSLGADDYVAKGSSSGTLEQSLTVLRGELVPKVKQFFSLTEDRISTAVSVRKPAPPQPGPRRSTAVSVIAIGVSTGGPQVLQQLIPQLPTTLSVPVLVVQHMPATFTRLLAERLAAASRLPVAEAEDGQELLPGHVLIAKGDHHLKVRRKGAQYVTVLDRGPHENSCRPSVDVLFRSLAENYGANVLSVVLTGMGSDGLRGTEVLKSAGALSIVQDEATSVVWGMPGAIATAGLADRVLPVAEIVPEILRLSERPGTQR